MPENPYCDWAHSTNQKNTPKKKDTKWYLFGAKNLFLLYLKTQINCYAIENINNVCSSNRPRVSVT